MREEVTINVKVVGANSSLCGQPVAQPDVIRLLLTSASEISEQSLFSTTTVQSHENKKFLFIYINSTTHELVIQLQHNN
jgi:hypothetical protein